MGDRATIHIGLPKTGTTSIQRFLALNAENLMRSGFHYPNFLAGQNHMELAAYAVGRGNVHLASIAGIRDLDHWLEWRVSFRETFLRETSMGGRWIFSSEHISERLKTESRVRDLRILLDKAFDQVDIIMYLRRQDELALSFYSTWVRDGISKPFRVDEVLESPGRFDFTQTIVRWKAEFSDDAIAIRLYPRQDSGTDLIEDFAATLGLPDISNWVRPKRLNTSLSAPELEFLRRFNKLVPRLDKKYREDPSVRKPRAVRWGIGSGRGAGLEPGDGAEDNGALPGFERSGHEALDWPRRRSELLLTGPRHCTGRL